MPTSHKYRLLKEAGWGIAIDVQGEALPLTGAALPSDASKVADGVWLQVDVGWPPSKEELEHLRFGLQWVATTIAQRRPETLPVLIRLKRLDFNPCDYQPEGLAVAVAEWAAQEFGFPKPEVLARFDRDRNRYVFSFDRVDGRSARPAAAGS